MARYDLFSAHNQKKLHSLQEALTTQKWKIFTAIPALLHYNFASLPGPGDTLEPHGFVRPYFLEDTMAAAAEYFSDLRGNPMPPRQTSFLGLYAMGSPGSVCFTSASDIDFWLIHATGALQPSDSEWLEKKLRGIERWAMDQGGLEVHFYVHDLSEIVKATFADDAEQAGEFGPILKEEFLRTATYVAGLPPAHWGGDDASLKIEFGPVPHLSTEQYLSACLIQLEKALQKPFKSALKIALLRRLAALPHEKLPSEIVFDLIEHGASPDPYMVLLDYLWEYFTSIGAEEDHAFLKSVLYLKIVDEETSRERLKRNREKLLATRFQSIGKPIDLDKFDAFFEWPFDARIKFSDQIARYLQTSVREISGHIEKKSMDPRKLRLLTKKILLRGGTGAVIENLAFADVPSRGEQSISIVRNPESDDWILSLQRFAGRPDFDKVVGIKTAPTVIPLIAFAVKNRLYHRMRTEIRGYPTDLFPRKVPEIIDAVTRLLESVFTADALEKPAVPDKHLIVMEQPISKDLKTRQLTVLTRTSWDGIEYRTFKGADALSAMSAELLGMKSPRHGVEAVIDASTGPDSKELAAFLMASFGAAPAEASVLKDFGQYLVIRDKIVFSAASPEELVIEYGRRGGSFRFCQMPSDDFGRLILDISARVRNSSESLFWFTTGDPAGFLLIDHSGKCDAWSVSKEDAKYNLQANAAYIEKYSGGKAIECYCVESRKTKAGPWHVAPFTPVRPGELSTDLHFNLVEGGFVAVRFGSRTIEPQAMPDACLLVAKLIKAARKKDHYYPPLLTGVTFPPTIQTRLTLPEATRMKREIELKIGRILAEMY